MSRNAEQQEHPRVNAELSGASPSREGLQEVSLQGGRVPAGSVSLGWGLCRGGGSVLARGVGVLQQRGGLGGGRGRFVLPARGTGALLTGASLQGRDRGHSPATPAGPPCPHPVPTPAMPTPSGQGPGLEL